MIAKNRKIGVIGLGYVGLPLAVAFSKKFEVIGFDINAQRITELSLGVDVTNEIDPSQLKLCDDLKFSSELAAVCHCDFYVITVPTPIDKFKEPDLSPLENASRAVGSILSKGDIVVYESTVFPGATEEFCVPLLENISGLKLGVDFSVGYSPERINPGDKVHTVENIIKVVSGSDEDTLSIVDEVYSEIISAGTFRAESIKVAEAAKVIENTQRDVNIALINELSKIFSIMEIDTEAVLKAAGTKWNFLNFTPGLVGGHCIGVDPYYLTYKAQSLGYHPEVILAGRRLNDGMGDYIVTRLVNAMVQAGTDLRVSNVLIMGYTFKENCPDTRNSKVADIYKGLFNLGMQVEVFDPWVEDADRERLEHINFVKQLEKGKYDAIILAVAHDDFRQIGAENLGSFCKSKRVIYDLKFVLPRGEADLRL